MPRLSRVLLAGVCLALVLSGCSEDDSEAGVRPGDSSSAAATPSPTPTPTPTGPVEPTLPVAAAGSDAAAAEAFVRFYWEMVNYAQATGDVAGLRALATEGCQACRGGLEGIEETSAEGGITQGGEITVKSSRAVRISVPHGRGYAVRISAIISSQVIRTPGQKPTRHRGGPIKLRVFAVLNDGVWKVARWDAVP